MLLILSLSVYSSKLCQQLGKQDMRYAVLCVYKECGPDLMCISTVAALNSAASLSTQSIVLIFSQHLGPLAPATHSHSGLPVAHWL